MILFAENPKTGGGGFQCAGPRHVSNGTRTTNTRRAGPDRKPGATLEINYRRHRVCVMDLNGCFNRSLNGRGVPPGLFSACRRRVDARRRRRPSAVLRRLENGRTRVSDVAELFAK